MSPQLSADRLATTRISAGQIGRGYRNTTLLARLAVNAKRRLEAHQALCADAPRKPAWLYDAQRDDARRSLPDQRLHDAIQEGIAGGWIDAQRLAEYFAELFLVHAATIAQHTGADDVSFCATVHEVAEALDAMAVARGLPTAENRAVAVRETFEAVITLQAHATELQRGSAA